MIEKYIEKEIMRQVKLTEFLYECRQLSIGDLAVRLKVSLNTIKRDFDKLIFLLEPYIREYKMMNTQVYLEFDSECTRYMLIKELYQYSKFLSVCSRYLQGKEDYSDIVDEEFVSVTKAFKLKKNVENYFIEAGILDENKNWINNEAGIRMVMISVWMRIPMPENLIDRSKMNLVHDFVNQLLEEMSNNYIIKNREYSFLALSIYLTILREKDHPVQDLTFNLGERHESLIFRTMKDRLSMVFKDIDLSNDEIVFLTAIYKNIPLNANNYMLLQMNYQYDRKFVIESNPYVKPLIFLFEEEFDNTFINQILFERPLIFFCYSTWNNIQNFIVYRHHYLNNEQIHHVKRIEKVLYRWKEQYLSDYPLQFDPLAIEWFASQITLSLSFKQKQKRIFFIVAESEESHILYRELLNHWLNLDYNTIDSFLYYSIDELPTYIQKNPYSIICERSVLLDREKVMPNLFPISRSSVKQDLKRILTESLEIRE